MKGIQPYTTYKLSGIAWLGDIPEHWEVSKAKHIFFQKKKTLNSELNCGSISFGKIVYKDNDRVPLETKATYQELLKGEFLINPLNLNFDLKSLRTGLSTIDVVVSTGYIVLQNNEKFNRTYLRWLLHQFDISFMKTLGDGVRQTLSYNDFKNTDLPYISLPEQTAIANFIDYKTAKIDRFIHKKKQLIKVLNEQKAGIINHAVTKGLDPNATMKDSGIEWLGNIPEHWGVKPLRNLVSLNDETLSEKTSPDYEIRYIDIGNVNSDGVVAEIVNYKFKDAPSRAKRIVKNGDVIISTVRTYLKAITQIKNDTDNLIVSTGFAVLRPRKLIISDFLNFAVRSNYFIETICSNSYGVSYPAINASQIMHFKIALPTENEQTEIVAYIEKETSQLNQLIQTIEKEIALTQEYRTALIAEAVTGKIDVRAFVIPTVSPQEELYEEIEEELEMVAEDAESYENE